MSVISAIRDYIKDSSELDSDAPVWVNYLGDGSPISYSIIPAAGARPVAEYLNGTREMEYTFAFQSVEYTIDEATRLATIEFFEDLAEWLRTQSENGEFPDLGTGKDVFLIEAVNWGVLIESGESQTGIYQINCRLEFTQAAD